MDSGENQMYLVPIFILFQIRVSIFKVTEAMISLSLFEGIMKYSVWLLE